MRPAFFKVPPALRIRKQKKALEWQQHGLPLVISFSSARTPHPSARERTMRTNLIVLGPER